MNTIYRYSQLLLGWIMLVFCGHGLWAQDSLFLQVQQAHDIDYPWPVYYTDSTVLVETLNNYILQQQTQGFLTANITDFTKQGNVYSATIELGPQYKWAALELGNMNPLWLNKLGFRQKDFIAKPVSAAKWVAFKEEIVTYAQNNGYPFASIRLDSIETDGNTLKGILHLEKGPLIQFRDIIIEGNPGIDVTFLKYYLGVKSEAVFSQKLIYAIPNRLQELPFVKMTGNPYLIFDGNEVDIRLPIDKKNASRLDLLVGILPDNDRPERWLITGLLDAELYNRFAKGEYFRLKLERLQAQTSKVELTFNYPYILKLPIGVHSAFHLHRFRDRYIDVSYEIGGSYMLQGRDYFRVVAKQQLSNVLNVDTTAVLLTDQLPDTLDVTRTSLGVTFHKERLDYKYNPRRGWLAEVSASFGTKRIRKNVQITELGKESLYDDINLSTFQYRFTTILEGYIPLGQISTIQTKFQGGLIFDTQSVYSNEQYLIGGSKLLRGFDEQAIAATYYGVGTLEYRLLLDRNSYLYAFGDIAYLDNTTTTTEVGEETVDWPLGFGAGVSFETKSGIFSISLAYGRQQGNRIDFSSPKVHAGFVSLF